MDQRRFDAIAKSLAGGLPRRRLLGRLGGGSLAALAALGWRAGSTIAQEQGGRVSIPCAPCGSGANRGGCCLPGVSGGGVVRTENGEAHLVLFATRLDTRGSQAAAGFVRWTDPGWEEKGLTLESVGPVDYGPVAEEEGARQVRGTMRANGAGDYPFVLRVVEAGPEAFGKDTASLVVGDRVVDGGSAVGFGYGAEGPLVGGDLQLLDSVAPIENA